MARKPTTDTMPIETVRHQDKRVNIPTEELRDFVAAIIEDVRTQAKKDPPEAQMGG